MKKRSFNPNEATWGDAVCTALEWLAKALFAFMFVLAGLWLCSCTSTRESVAQRDLNGVIEFEYDNVLGYDADRNVLYYDVVDTVKGRGGVKVYHNVIEVSCCGVLIEELEQGTPVYIDQKILLYD